MRLRPPAGPWPPGGATLQRGRPDSRVNGAVTFGMNAIVLDGEDRILRAGQSVRADFRFD